MDRTAITEAVARGWCHPKNEKKVMDADLAFAIIDEISDADDTPNLGCATTIELIEELRARAEVGGYGEYRTIDE